MIVKKKPTRLKPIGRTPSARVKERGDSIGRKVIKPPRPTRKPRDAFSKVLMAPEPQTPRTTKRPKPKFSKGVGSLLGGAAASVLKTAAGASSKGKKGKPADLKRPPRMTKEDLDKLKRLLKDKMGNTKRGDPVKPKFRKPVKKRRAGFMKK